MSTIKTKYFWTVSAIALLALMIAVGGAWSYLRGSAYEVTVQITNEQRADYENQIIFWDKKIKSVMPPEKPDMDFFLAKARYQEYLGKYGPAIDTLLESFKYYENTTAGWNNIAKLYDKVGDYQSAIVFYSKLIQYFNLNRYYLDLAWDYYKQNRLPLAREAYARYAQLGPGSDEQLLKLLYPNTNVK